MCYDHANKIGNEGDLVKHSVLLSVQIDLLRQYTFIYAESHAGRAEYVLPEGGEWRRGVGKFSQNDSLRLDWQNLKEWLKREDTAKPGENPEPNPKYPRLESYYSYICQGRPLAAGMKYPGSSLLVFRLFEYYVPPPRLFLWETDEKAYADLFSAHRPHADVSVHLGDGFSGVANLQEASLVLIDPPAIDPPTQDRILSTLEALQTKGIPFLCWTARLAEGRDAESVESPDSLGFYRRAKEAGYSCLRMSWPRAEGRTMGCQLTLSKKLVRGAKKTLAELCEIMGWRRPR